MSSLRERVEGLVARAKGWTETDLRKFPIATLELIDALAAALVADGPLGLARDSKGINEAGICEVCGHDTKEGEKLLGCVTIEHCCNLLADERTWWHKKFHWATGIPCDGTLEECKRAAAPSLHKEGAGLMQKSQREASDAAEKADCEKALLALAGWYPTPVEGYGFNTSWAISDLCRAIQQLRVTSPSLPLQRTLPDEQFKGVVVEAIESDCTGDQNCKHECPDAATIRREALEEAAEEADWVADLKGGSNEEAGLRIAKAIRALAASPAGRAEVSGTESKGATNGPLDD